MIWNKFIIINKALRSNHQRILESIEINLASQERQKNDAIKNKRKLESELTELEQSLDTAQHSMAELKNKNEKLQSTIFELKTSLEASEAQIYDLKSQVFNNEFKSNQFQMEIGELKILLASKNRRLESLIITDNGKYAIRH